MKYDLDRLILILNYKFIFTLKLLRCMKRLLPVLSFICFFMNCIVSLYAQNYSFKTGPVVKDIDGNSYSSIVTICSQTWANKNLSVGRYRNGDLIPQVTDSTQWAVLKTGAWCWYDNDSVKYWQYGKLYNWYAVNDPRGLAPIGWHVPSDEEWNKLVKCIYPYANTGCYNCSQSSTVGGVMKEAGTSHWKTPNTGASNNSGITCLPGGYRSLAGEFINLGYNGLWWCSSESDADAAWDRFLYYKSAEVIRQDHHKGVGQSVLFVRD